MGEITYCLLHPSNGLFLSSFTYVEAPRLRGDKGICVLCLHSSADDKKMNANFTMWASIQANLLSWMTEYECLSPLKFIDYYRESIELHLCESSSSSMYTCVYVRTCERWLLHPRQVLPMTNTQNVSWWLKLLPWKCIPRARIIIIKSLSLI